MTDIKQSQSVERLGRLLQRLIEQTGTRIETPHEAGIVLSHPEAGCHPNSYLAVFLYCAEATWLRIGGSSFGIEIADDPAGSLGIRVTAVRAESLVTVMLCLIDIVTTLRNAQGSINMLDACAMWKQSIYQSAVLTQPAAQVAA